MINNIVTDPPKDKELYDFIRNKSLFLANYMNIPDSIEDFREQFNTDEKLFKLYEHLSIGNLLSDKNKEFKNFKINAGFDKDQSQSPAVNLLDNKDKTEIIPQSNEIFSEEDVNKNFEDSQKKINEEFEISKSNYKDQLDKKDIGEREYSSLINNLTTKKNKDSEINVKKKNEDLNRIGLANPVVSYFTYDESGKRKKQQTGIHDWAFRQKGEDTSKGDAFFTMSPIQQEEKFIPFLKNRYKGFDFELKYKQTEYDDNSGELQKKIPNELIVRNDKGSQIVINLDKKNIYSNKKELISFLNKNGVDQVAIVKSLSDEAEMYNEVFNKPFNPEDTRIGGIGLNESDKEKLDVYGDFKQTKTDIGEFKEFKYNKDLFTTPRQDLANEMVTLNLLTPQEAKDPYSKNVALKMLNIINSDPFYSEKGQTAEGYGYTNYNVRASFKEVNEGSSWVETTYSLDRTISGPDDIAEQYTELKNQINSQRTKFNQPLASDEEIKTQLARNLYEKNRAEALNSHWDKYLANATEQDRGKLLGASLTKSDSNIDEAYKLQALNKLELENYEDPNNEDNLLIDYFEEIYNDPTKDFPPGDGKKVTLENGKIVPKSLLKQYNSAISGKKARLDTMLNRMNQTWELQDESGDINASLDMLNRDYNTWRKSINNTALMFGDIGMGISYMGSKAIKGIGYGAHAFGTLMDSDLTSEEWDEEQKIWEDYDDAFADWGQEWTDKKEQIRKNFAKDVGFHQDKWGGRSAFAGDFGTFVAQEISTQIPILATMILSGGTLGPILMGAYSAGDHWMQDDMEERKTGVYRSEWKQAAAAIGYGASEAIFEKLTTVPILRRGGNLISRMGERSIFEYKDAMKQYFKSKLPQLPLETASEMVGEGLTQVAQNLIDGKDALQDVDHAAFVGGLFGFGMTASPFIAGAVAARFTDYNSMAEFRKISGQVANLESQKINMIANGINIDAVEQNINSLKDKQRVMLDKKFNQISTSLSNQAMNSLIKNYSKQENIRTNVKNILNNDKISKQTKQNLLELEKREFDNLEFSSKTWKNSGAFGNDWVLQKELNPQRYERIVSQAKENLKANRNKVDDIQESAIQAEAYDIYVAEEITANYERQKAINQEKGIDVQLILSETNKDARILLDNMEAETIERLNKEGVSEDVIATVKENYKGLKQSLAEGIVNGVDISEGFSPDGKTKSIIFKEVAIKNDKRQVGTHEIGHWAFSKLIGRNSKDFEPLANSIVDYLSQTAEGRTVLERITKRDAQVSEMADELVMNFLEEVGNNNVPISNDFAALFGVGTNEGLMKSTNGEMSFDFKGSTDAVAFVIGMGKAIASGQLTTDIISQAKESKVIKDVKAKSNEAIIENVLKEVGIKKSMSETSEERKSRQDNRNKLLDKVYNEQALDEDGKPVSKQEFSEFLETREGKDFVAEVLMMSYNDMLAIVKGDELKVDFNPLIKHIEAFNPQKKVTEGKFDLKGYFGRFLKLKTQTGSKQVAKTDAPKGTIRIDQKREGARDIDIEDKSTTPDIDPKAELNFRNKLKIKTGGDLYNSILKKAKIILSTLSTNLTVPKTNTTLKEVKAELKENPNNNKAIGNLNKIFKDFRKTLKNAFDTQLFKEIKDSMGTREAYNEYLRSNKKAILTGLPIADLVAMQKAKGAKKILVKPIKENLSPNEIKRYEGSQDLMYTSPTSGPTVYERLNPGDKEFVDFFNVRGRKDALARNIAGKLGEDATMETLASEDVMDAFLTKNPTLKQIPTDMLSNSIAQAIDSGVSLKFSSNAQKEVFKEYGNDFVENLKEQNLGINRKSIEAALYKTFINENPTKVWGETIEEQQKTLSKFAKELVTPVKKYLKPEGKRSLKALKAVPNFGEFTLEEIAQRELDTNLTKILDLKKDGVKSLAEESELPENVTLMRELEADFINYLVDKYGKVKAVKIALTMLKGHNATSAKMGATNLGTLSEFNEKGKRRESRYQYFESLEDFVNSTLNTIPGVEIEVDYTKGDSPKAFIKSIVIDKKPIKPFGSRESQTSKSKEHFEETYDKREKESQEAWDVLTEYLEFMYKNGNNLSFALTMMALKSNMDTILKSSALAKYYYVGPKMSPSKLRYEHMIPTEYVALKLTQHFVGEKIDLQALKDKYNVAIIPKTMDENINVQLQKSMPSFWNETLSETERYFNDLMLGYQNMYALEVVGGKNKGEIIGENFLELNDEVIKAKDSNIQTLSNDVVKFKKSGSNSDVIGYAKTVDEALSVARDLDAPVKKIRVFDFDDTLATTKSDVLFTAPDGTKGKLNAEEFAKDGSRLLEEGYVFDFSEFNKVTKGKPGPLLDIAKKIQEARGTEDVFVLTARAPEAQVAIKEFLDSVGLNIPLENITGLGNSTGAAKAKWIVDKAAKGYNDFYFADDAYQNVKAVQDALDQIDVKSKVQQAKLKFSKSVNEDFNKIIEQTTGIASEKRYSKAKAKVRGAGKGNKKFFIPYSAEDFMGLIYPLLSKGKLGDSQMAWFKEHLLDPYARAMENVSRSRINLLQDFKALKKALEIPKNLRKKNDSGFTNEQAVRVYLFNKTGNPAPGLSKTDTQELLDVVNSDGLLKAFADEILNLTKGDGYSKPGSDWLAGTITTDLLDVLNNTKRAKYLEQSGFKQNAELIFNEENLNKLEAAYGEKYRDAMENVLKRMDSGKNRIFSGNRLSNRVLDYINGSIGTIMFFNTRSAVLQTISNINFLNWSFNNPIKAGKAFANQKQYWKDFKDLMNSDYLVDRRNGLKLNINENEIADAAATSKNKAKAAMSYILQKGFLPTQFADSFAIASGGATFYRNRINDLIKNQGMSEADAKKQAMLEFRQVAETSQQSSDPSKISAQQASDLGRVVLAFANTPMQYARIQKRAIQDLVNRRGDAKTNVSKIIYYGVVQNLIFNALQQALFALGAGDDEDEMSNKEKEKYEKTKQKKYMGIANGMLDSQLRGLGIAGASASVVKNFLLDVYERSDKKRPEYVDAVYKLIQISPPISSKISKVRQAAYQFDSKKRREEIFDKGFSIDNPAYEAASKVISATTNLPLDRLYNKANNIEAALAEDTEAWQTIAMLAGWPEWQIKPNGKTKDQVKSFKSSNSKSKNPFARSSGKNKNPFAR